MAFKAPSKIIKRGDIKVEDKIFQKHIKEI